MMCEEEVYKKEWVTIESFESLFCHFCFPPKVGFCLVFHSSPDFPPCNKQQSNTYNEMRIRLCQITTPDTDGESASDFGVRFGGEDVSVAGLTVVGPTL